MDLSKLKYYVERSEYSVRDFCQKSGIKTPTYYKAIKDNDIRASVLETMCVLLKVDPTVFFDKIGVYSTGSHHTLLEEPAADYKTRAEELHIGRIIEARLNEIGMSIAEFGRIIGTTRQNAKSILQRKNITLEYAIEYNEALNPSGSSPWDIFEFFLREKPETVEEKYIRLLEEVNQRAAKTKSKKQRLK